MALGLVAAVGYPLWRGAKEEFGPAATVDLVVQHGVAYTDPDELALDQALGRVGGEAEAATSVAETALDLEALLEQRVANLRQRSGPAPAPASAGPRCPQCGAGYDPEDAFCVRCGASLSQVCPNCGHPHDADDLFCSRCGQKL
jgi:hypothetical protein